MATEFLAPAQKVRTNTVAAGNNTYTTGYPNVIRVTGLPSGTSALLVIVGPDNIPVTLTVYIGYELRLSKFKEIRGSGAGSTAGVIYETLWIG